MKTVTDGMTHLLISQNITTVHEQILLQCYSVMEDVELLRFMIQIVRALCSTTTSCQLGLLHKEQQAQRSTKTDEEAYNIPKKTMRDKTEQRKNQITIAA
jgi:hypothetical protein